MLGKQQNISYYAVWECEPEFSALKTIKSKNQNHVTELVHDVRSVVKLHPGLISLCRRNTYDIKLCYFLVL